jgi:predicted  nucleic acid-binding Zn-ribbon protein
LTRYSIGTQALRKEIAALKKRISLLESSVMSCGKKTDSLQNKLDKKHQEYIEYKTLYRRSLRDLERLKKRLAEQDKNSSPVRAEPKSFYKSLVDKNKEISNLKRSVSRKDNTIRELKERLALQKGKTGQSASYWKNLYFLEIKRKGK